MSHLTHLPNKATIRLFNLAGVMVRTIEKDNNSTYQRWDLANESGLPVASGLYIAYIEMPDLGETKDTEDCNYSRTANSR